MLSVFSHLWRSFFYTHNKTTEKIKRYVHTSYQLDIICHWKVKRAKYIWILLLHVELITDKIQFAKISLTSLSLNLILFLTSTHNVVNKLWHLLYNSIVTLAQWAVVHNILLQFAFKFNRLRKSVLFDVDYIIIFWPNHMYEYVFIQIWISKINLNYTSTWRMKAKWNSVF